MGEVAYCRADAEPSLIVKFSLIDFPSGQRYIKPKHSLGCFGSFFGCLFRADDIAANVKLHLNFLLEIEVVAAKA